MEISKKEQAKITSIENNNFFLVSTEPLLYEFIKLYMTKNDITKMPVLFAARIIHIVMVRIRRFFVLLFLINTIKGSIVNI